MDQQAFLLVGATISFDIRIEFRVTWGQDDGLHSDTEKEATQRGGEVSSSRTADPSLINAADRLKKRLLALQPGMNIISSRPLAHPPLHWYDMSKYSDSLKKRIMSKEAPITPINPEAMARAYASALPEGHLRLIVETFEALADLTRARVLHALVQQPLCVRDLALLTGISESGMSHQLRILRDRRLVKSRRKGNIIYYEIDDHHVAALFREADYHVDHLRRELPDHPY
jgi:DNA-binding transcriptional ArsR family regulator